MFRLGHAEDRHFPGGIGFLVVQQKPVGRALTKTNEERTGGSWVPGTLGLAS